MQDAITGDGYRLVDCPLLVVILTAYTPTEMGDAGFYQGQRLVGVPDWMNAERYDIAAKVDEAALAAWKNPDARRGMLRGMVQSMLAERFKLKVHRETKEVSGYALVIGKNGPKLQTAESSDAATILAKHPGGQSIPGGQGGAVLLTNQSGKFNLYGASAKTIALLLTILSGSPVVDKTGLTETYDVELKAAMSTGPVLASDAADTGPSVFTAVQTQLGLKMEAQKVQVENLVIDHVERPSEN